MVIATRSRHIESSRYCDSCKPVEREPSRRATAALLPTNALSVRPQQSADCPACLLPVYVLGVRQRRRQWHCCSNAVSIPSEFCSLTVKAFDWNVPQDCSPTMWSVAAAAAAAACISVRNERRSERTHSAERNATCCSSFRVLDRIKLHSLLAWSVRRYAERLHSLGLDAFPVDDLYEDASILTCLILYYTITMERWMMKNCGRMFETIPVKIITAYIIFPSRWSLCLSPFQH